MYGFTTGAFSLVSYMYSKYVCEIVGKTWPLGCYLLASRQFGSTMLLLALDWLGLCLARALVNMTARSVWSWSRVTFRSSRGTCQIIPRVVSAVSAACGGTRQPSRLPLPKGLVLFSAFPSSRNIQSLLILISTLVVWPSFFFSGGVSRFMYFFLLDSMTSLHWRPEKRWKLWCLIMPAL